MALALNHKKAIIFDFDGTLVDIEPLFIEVFNALAPEFRYAPLLPDDIPEIKKLGAREFIQRRLKIPFWKIWKLERRGKEEYRRRMEHIGLFPGMKEVVEQLRNGGYRVGILSSNASSTVSDLVKKFDMEVDFISQSAIFGKARAIRKTLKKENLDIAAVIYVGDEVRDVEACREIGVDMLAVTWGLNEKESLILAGAPTADTPEELLSRLLP
ncbi:MAG: hypothetical protein A3E38_00570 [Candidatus Moranbacteria bacterium RIFCSPHIGHO2_12_FULL_54_9]|nr:MAG: hypothetical protein A2878_00800 [Candidatus Moranbacteria bacterium RIFCSPHIGHO2_01_FULL_54_31]OGI24739.1 MAG: hypothetical protein A3E38_00570 [Candidatus Moranbacteria bacterium RIFCSPHIGHO2_12_FULL_54_9]